MTTSELYAVYCQAYAIYDPSHRDAARTLIVAGSAIERAIVEFAVEDAENGTPRRSREQFTRAVEAGLAALAPLGLRAA
jgi:hypothetical protein